MLVAQARRDAIGTAGRRNLARAWIWQRNVGILLVLEIAGLVDVWLAINRPPATDFLVVIMTTAGFVAAWLIWRSCNRTLSKMGVRAW